MGRMVVDWRSLSGSFDSATHNDTVSHCDQDDGGGRRRLAGDVEGTVFVVGGFAWRMGLEPCGLIGG